MVLVGKVMALLVLLLFALPTEGRRVLEGTFNATVAKDEVVAGAGKGTLENGLTGVTTSDSCPTFCAAIIPSALVLLWYFAWCYLLGVILVILVESCYMLDICNDWVPMNKTFIWNLDAIGINCPMTDRPPFRAPRSKKSTSLQVRVRLVLKAVQTYD